MMGILQEAFDKEIAKLPHIALRDVIAEKLEEKGIDDTALATRIADHLWAGNASFDWDDAPDV